MPLHTSWPSVPFFSAHLKSGKTGKITRVGGFKWRWLWSSSSLRFVSILSLYHDSKEKADAAKKTEGAMQALQGKVDAANQAQENNTKAFLESLRKMSGEVTDLKAEVRTEPLQKKLASVQAELVNTEKALTPGPKAELTFSFVPYSNPPVGQPVVPSTDVTLPIKADGSVHVDFTVLNLTDVEATNAELQIQLCDACKFAKEPEVMQKLPGMKDTERYLLLPHQQPHQSLRTLTVDVIPPPSSPWFALGFSYRCTTCIVPKELSMGTVHVMRP